MKDLVEKQNEEIELFNASFETKLLLKQFISEVRKETAEAVLIQIEGMLVKDWKTNTLSAQEFDITNEKFEKLEKQIIKEL